MCIPSKGKDPKKEEKPASKREMPTGDPPATLKDTEKPAPPLKAEDAKSESKHVPTPSKSIKNSQNVSEDPANFPNHQRTISAENPTISHYGLSGNMRDNKPSQENPPSFGNESRMDDKSEGTIGVSTIKDMVNVKETEISPQTSPRGPLDFSKKVDNKEAIVSPNVESSKSARQEKVDTSKSSGQLEPKTPEKDAPKPTGNTPNKAAILAKNPLLGSMALGGMKLATYGFNNGRKPNNLYGIPLSGMKLSTPKARSTKGEDTGPTTPQKSDREAKDKTVETETAETPVTGKATPQRPYSENKLTTGAKSVTPDKAPEVEVKPDVGSNKKPPIGAGYGANRNRTPPKPRGK